MSIETYESIIAINEMDKEIAEAEAELEKGAKLLEGREILTNLRDKYARKV